MCTCGAVTTVDPNGEPIILLGKTIDFYESGFWHGKVSHTHGNHSLGCGLIPQIGTNAGINEKGLGVLLSFLDYRGPFEWNDSNDMPNKWESDDRALLNAQLLAKCSTTEEAIESLYEHVPKYPMMPGGNHMFADIGGNIAVFEHCNGEMNHRYYNEEKYTSRGNNGYLTILKEQENLPEKVKFDRSERANKMASALTDILEKPVSEKDAINRMQLILSHNDNNNEIGSICINNLVLPGARASTHLPLATVTAVIFSLTKRTMYFTKENPIHNQWYTLSL